MKFRNFTVAALLILIGMGGCQQEESLVKKEEISQDTLDKIYQMGFGTNDVQSVEGGYLVEGDIFLTASQLNDSRNPRFLRIGEVEQYRTTNLVSATKYPVITISLSSKFPSSYIAATDEAIARYNAENLSIKFERVSANADIELVTAGGNFLASAGFPTSAGDPYGQVKVNTRSIGNQPQGTVASILAHEIGHCIGFRHTDYMNRAYSCGGAASNEGASTVGAVHVPGTPTGPDPNSWMLACIGSGQNRPFNSNDKTALSYLY